MPGWGEAYLEGKRGIKQSIGQLQDTAMRLKELREGRKQQRFQNVMGVAGLGLQGIGLAHDIKTGREQMDIAKAGEARVAELHGPAMEVARLEPIRVQAAIDTQKVTTNKLEQDIVWVGMQMAEYPATIEHQRNIEDLQVRIEQDKATVARLDAEWRQAQVQYEPQKLELLGKEIVNDAKELDVRLQEAQTRLDIAKLQLAGLSQEQAGAILPALSQVQDLWLKSRPQYSDVNGIPDSSKWQTPKGKEDFKRFLIESGEAANLGIDPAEQNRIIDAFWGGGSAEGKGNGEAIRPPGEKRNLFDQIQTMVKKIKEAGGKPDVPAKLVLLTYAPETLIQILQNLETTYAQMKPPTKEPVQKPIFAGLGTLPHAIQSPRTPSWTVPPTKESEKTKWWGR